MSTIRELYYNIKNIIKGGLASDDIALSDRQIKHWVNIERGALIKSSIEKEKTINANFEQSLGCVLLEKTDKAECQDLGIFTGKTIMKSIVDIPKPIFTSFGGELITNLQTVYGQPIEFNSAQMGYYAQFQKYAPRKKIAYLKNGRLYVENAEGMEIVKITGIFEDPELVYSFINCDGTVCFNEDSDYPLTSDLISKLYENIQRKYLPTLLATNQDKTNDANSTK